MVVEKTVKYSTIVDTLAEAWVFIMAHVDLIGPLPFIKIQPLMLYDPDRDEDEPPEYKFEAVVKGTGVLEPAEQEVETHDRLP